MSLSFPCPNTNCPQTIHVLAGTEGEVFCPACGAVLRLPPAGPVPPDDSVVALPDDAGPDMPAAPQRTKKKKRGKKGGFLANIPTFYVGGYEVTRRRVLTWSSVAGFGLLILCPFALWVNWLSDPTAELHDGPTPPDPEEPIPDRRPAELAPPSAPPRTASDLEASYAQISVGMSLREVKALLVDFRVAGHTTERLGSRGSPVETEGLFVWYGTGDGDRRTVAVRVTFRSDRVEKKELISGAEAEQAVEAARRAQASDR